MGIISLEQKDRLLWLGRYSERVYTTIRLFFMAYDSFIDDLNITYEELCRQLDIPDVYGSKKEFCKKYAFDEEDVNSIFSNLNRAYHDTFEFTNDMSTYQKAEMMMRRLYQDFVYQKHITDCNTSAEDAFILGKGVCQDYAQILIALCHLEKIPARYVAGMMIGEGASHAWVEICQDGIWYGLDPTNNKLVDDDYIKLSHGRDASDCLINRGVIVGGGEQTQDIKVHVWEE